MKEKKRTRVIYLGLLPIALFALAMSLFFGSGAFTTSGGYEHANIHEANNQIGVATLKDEIQYEMMNALPNDGTHYLPKKAEIPDPKEKPSESFPTNVCVEKMANEIPGLNFEKTALAPLAWHLGEGTSTWEADCISKGEPTELYVVDEGGVHRLQVHEHTKDTDRITKEIVKNYLPNSYEKFLANMDLLEELELEILDGRLVWGYTVSEGGEKIMFFGEEDTQWWECLVE